MQKRQHEKSYEIQDDYPEVAVDVIWLSCDGNSNNSGEFGADSLEEAT